MTEMEELVRRLKGGAGAQKTVDEFWETELAKWRDDCGILMTQLKSWLAPGVEAGVFFVGDLEVALNEEHSDYVVPGLKIDLLTPAMRNVQVLPRGMRIVGIVSHGPSRVVGARGRVDLVSGPARAVLLRFVDGATLWRVVTQSSPPADLSADKFAEVISELVE